LTGNLNIITISGPDNSGVAYFKRNGIDIFGIEVYYKKIQKYLYTMTIPRYSE